VNNLDTINVLGGNLIVFEGTGFPFQIERNAFILQFNDNGNTACTVIETSPERMVCRTEAF